MDTPEPPKIIPIIEEDLEISTRAAKTGSVQVNKTTEEVPRVVDFELMRDVVEVHRVLVNQVVDARPPVRETKDEIIVPVVEEEVVISKRLVLREEVHLIRKRTAEQSTEEVELKRDKVQVRRLDADGREIGRE